MERSQEWLRASYFTLKRGIMTIMQVQELGSSGEEILDFLNDIVYSVNNKESKDGFEFECEKAKAEHIEICVAEVQRLLCNLKQKEDRLW